VSRDFCLFKFPNVLPEDVDGDAEKDDEDEAYDDERKHPVAQDSSICIKIDLVHKRNYPQKTPVIVAGAFCAVISVIRSTRDHMSLN
jgi:hypothetical protein